MGQLLQFKQKPKQTPEEVVAAYNAVEHLRSLMHMLPNDKSRVDFAMMLLAQICMWICKSSYYSDPAAVVKSWIARKTDLYTKHKKEG